MSDKPENLADRMAHIEPFHVMSLLAKARQLEAQGQHIVHMEIGEPDFTTPEPVLRAAENALKKGHTHYTPAVGLLSLREKIAEHYLKKYNAQVSPEQIIITPGASGALMLSLGVLVNPDDNVIMSDPGYPCNRHFVRLFDANPVELPVDASSHYQLTVQHLKDAKVDNAKAIMLASPSNPTGTLLSQQQLQDWIEYSANKKVSLLVDEIYQGLVYGKQSTSIATQTNTAFIINSFSKYFCMTGWRLGWLVVPAGYEYDVDKLAQNIYLAPSTISQYAALAAFDEDTTAELEQHRLEFQRRRDFMIEAVADLGFNLMATPEGAFYLYADCRQLTDDSFSFCERVLEEAGVALTPGKDFGNNQSHQYVRFAYTTSMDQLELGVERLRRYLTRQ
ncbi:aminotransferase class I/II-fold pyridoxal phosphate-dependent enzyme [Kaarinaea lacus]